MKTHANLSGSDSRWLGTLKWIRYHQLFAGFPRFRIHFRAPSFVTLFVTTIKLYVTLGW